MPQEPPKFTVTAALAAFLAAASVKLGFAAAITDSKTTPVDADDVVIFDSGASGVTKRVSFANLWNFVKAKLDTPLTLAGLKTFTTSPRSTGTPTVGTDMLNRDQSDTRYKQMLSAVAGANFALTETTTYTDDPALTVPLTAGTWLVELLCIVTAEITDPGILAQVDFTGSHTSGAATIFIQQGISATPAHASSPATSATRPDGTASASLPRVVINGAGMRTTYTKVEHTIVVATAGNYVLRLAQNTSHAAAITRRAGSRITATKLS